MEAFSIRHTIEFPPPIVAAAIFGLPTIIGIMLKSGADIEATCSKGFTPLLMAAEMGHSSVVLVLVASKANLFAKDFRGENSLHKASLGGYTEIVKQLVSAEPSLIEIPLEENFHKTALHLAIGSRHEGVIRALIDAGADLNAPDGLKLPPLMKSIVVNLPEIIDLLIEKEVDVDANGFGDNAALSMAATSGNTDDVKKSLAAEAKVDASTNAYSGMALIRVTSSVHRIMPSLPSNLLVIVRMLIVLMYSTLHPSGMKVVIKAGANIQAKDKNGETALHCIKP
ncbi:hypothetical protein OCU04_011366 [Sclerotinia nivalis]|uniref:Ankyrin repeat protein n=1 Tax=Sclerotinia nivalis TaxID=352851 RepID=A0A9X0ABC9_9HELO|nr:hypothetical protein OCU04_011366 [Sclerotinia nivalis]